jgi:hypothetical protein
MSASRCWITFESDKALQSRIRRGDFGEKDELYLPINCFPASGKGYWISILHQWCKKREIPFVDEGLQITAKVKKDQIEDFIEFAYAGDPSYSEPARMLTWKGRAYLSNSLTDLRAFVAQQLNGRLWYEIKADEF